MSLLSSNNLPYHRRKTRLVYVGQVAVGGNAPVRVQSMTTSDTKDTASIIPEIEGLVNAGCEIVRVTVPTQADCDNLPTIRAEMKKRGIKVPLVADIHFTPSIAMKVVEYVEKVRINPGNFVDKKLFKVWEYNDQQYTEELERLREKFSPLVLKCKEYGIAMRIGTNHGSLSDRILNRYGDTPQGMVESAFEFLKICEDFNYHDIILSMKASNVQVMIEAYRLLAKRLEETKRDYPFHLGVTEAGSGAEGRVKSAIGIGALLEDGIGDTVRVSLTEDSIHEIPVAYQLVAKYNALHALSLTQKSFDVSSSHPPKIYSQRKESGRGEPIRVWATWGDQNKKTFIQDYYSYSQSQNGKERPIEGIEIDGDSLSDTEIQQGALKLQGISLSLKTSFPEKALKYLDTFSKITGSLSTSMNLSLWEPVIQKVIHKEKIIEWNLKLEEGEISVSSERINSLIQLSRSSFCFSLSADQPVWAYRKLVEILETRKINVPIHLRYHTKPTEAPLLAPSIALGSLLNDGIGNSLQIESILSLGETIDLAYNILQGCRQRISKTEYISCPSCGRTQFDLQTTTERIRQKTSHLVGVKIAVMGCVVNGPGEMADADFGYVGTGPKKVSLYIGKECVERNISEQEALDRLISLIKSQNRWVDPI